MISQDLTPVAELIWKRQYWKQKLLRMITNLKVALTKLLFSVVRGALVLYYLEARGAAFYTPIHFSNVAKYGWWLTSCGY